MKYGYSKELRSSVHPLPPSSTRLCNLCRAGFLGALTIQWTSVHGLGTFGRCHYPAFKYTFVNSVSFFDEPSHAVRDSMELLDPLHEYILSCRTYTEYVYIYTYNSIFMWRYVHKMHIYTYIIYVQCTSFTHGCDGNEVWGHPTSEIVCKYCPWLVCKRCEVYFAWLSKMRTWVLSFNSRRRTPRNLIVICKPVKRQYLPCHALHGKATRRRSSLTVNIIASDSTTLDQSDQSWPACQQRDGLQGRYNMHHEWLEDLKQAEHTSFTKAQLCKWQTQS